MNNRNRILGMALATALVCVSASIAMAASTPEQSCQSKRLKAWTKYEGCVGKAMGAVYAGKPLDATAQAALAKCRTKLAAAWPKLSAIVGSATCSGQPRFVDNGNGTIRDNLSGRTWSKQGDQAAEPFDKDSIYDWSFGSPYGSDGTAFDYMLDVTNGSVIGGHQDWRVPTIAELLSIVLAGPLPCGSSPCIEPAFNASCTANCSFFSSCSCSVPYPYWTDVSVPEAPNMAYAVDFGDGELFEGFKTLDRNVRLVRGGLH